MQRTKELTMSQPIDLENIEELRREAGIDDIELRDEVRALRIGDCVRLTARVDAQPFPGECLLVRITSIKGDVFRGKLTRTPSSARLARLKAGCLLKFTGEHIHSVVSKQPAGEAARG